MAKIKTTTFDAAEYLETPEDIALFLNDMLENGTESDFLHGLDAVARSIGMARIAASAGVGRQSLYKSLSGQTKPEFGTVLKIIQAAGLRLQVAA